MKTRKEKTVEMHDVSVEPHPDPAYENAVVVVTYVRRCSTAWLRRKFGIDRRRAARLVEMMEWRGSSAPHAAPEDGRCWCLVQSGWNR